MSLLDALRAGSPTAAEFAVAASNKDQGVLDEILRGVGALVGRSCWKAIFRITAIKYLSFETQQP